MPSGGAPNFFLRAYTHAHCGPPPLTIALVCPCVRHLFVITLIFVKYVNRTNDVFTFRENVESSRWTKTVINNVYRENDIICGGVL